MYVSDLKRLLDCIQCDSMSRDEVFYDSGEGTTERRIKFFGLIDELQGFFKYYNEHKEQIMNSCEEDEVKDCVFSDLVKNTNNTYRETTMG